MNPFHGRIDGSTVRIGDDSLPHRVNDFSQGDEVVAFARPHELDIVIDPASTAGVSARIARVLSFGVTARVELDGLNGVSGQHFEVEMTRTRVEELGLQEGQPVRLLPSQLRVFAR
ncbi:MAG: TOBE-like domain-containing protein [Rhodanobacter thiooxydans]|nr:TOBE-like domain-containing protein [Rhodanobacter thiooxydans]